MQSRNGQAPYLVTVDSDTVTTRIAKKFIKRYLLDQKSEFSNPKEQVKIESIDGKGSDVLQHMRDHTPHIFDFVFLDANKKGYVDYVKFLMGEESGSSGGGRVMLSDNALLVVDNTLWKGMVLQEVPSLAEGKSEGGDRMQKLAAAMHAFNMHCKEHPQLSPVLLPIRDGLTIVRYKAKTTIQ